MDIPPEPGPIGLFERSLDKLVPEGVFRERKAAEAFVELL